MISSADVRSIFMPVIEQIIKLVEGQMQKLEAQGKSVNGIVLVGGFGQSNCLFKCLQARFAGRKRSSSTRAGSLPRFEIMQPINAWTAVVRGAVMRGLEGAGQVLSRKSRRAYGVTAARPWNSAVHSKIDKFWHANEQVWKASNQMNWFIRKGDTCMANKPVLFCKLALPYVVHLEYSRD